jgi:hypothetical protein
MRHVAEVHVEQEEVDADRLEGPPERLYSRAVKRVLTGIAGGLGPVIALPSRRRTI